MSRIFAIALARQIPTLIVLAGLAFLGWWGAVHEWRVREMFPWFAKAPDAPKKAEAESPNPNVSPDEIKLASPESAATAGIETAEATRSRLSHIVSAPGTLAFDQTRFAQPAARVSGTAWRVLAGTGKRVRKDEVLALIAAPEAGKARADFLAAWVSHDVKARQVERFQAASGSIPPRQILDARETLREARVTMLNAHQALANLGLGVPLDSLRELADDQVLKRVRFLGVPASLQEEADLPASLVSITAPLDGLVIRRDLILGEQTGPGQTAFVVADTSKLWLLIDVRQEDADRLALGQPVTFRSIATGRNSSGELTWISAEVDAKTRTVKARAEIANSSGTLRPATFGQVEIEVGTGSGVTVPRESVQWDGQSRRVFVRRDGQTFEPRFVLTGTSRDRKTELLDPRSLLPAGLVGGDRFGRLAWLAAAEELLVPVAPGDVVATDGSNVLKAEMLKARIGGDE